jgi:hypothetical protein
MSPTPCVFRDANAARTLLSMAISQMVTVRLAEMPAQKRGGHSLISAMDINGTKAGCEAERRIFNVSHTFPMTALAAISNLGRDA